MRATALDRRTFLGRALATTAQAIPGLPAHAVPLAQPAPLRNQAKAKIDIHVHLGRDRQEMGRMSKDTIAPAVRYMIGEMDKYNIQKSMIVAVEPIFPTEIYLEAAKLEPQRLMTCCSLIPRPAGPAVDKLRSYRDRGAKALKLQPMQYDPKDPAVEAVIYEAVKLGMPVLFHHTDLPRSFVDMLTHLASSFPDGNFVVIHFGGVYGFWDVLPLARLSNVYLETSTAFPRVVKSPMRNMLHFLIEENRLNQLIFGSEHPLDYAGVFSAIDDLVGATVKEDVVKAVYKGNAEKILKLSS